MTEFRFCVGSPQGLRSTVWKIFTGSKIKNDVYIQSRAMGNSFKVSIHESGVCQSSLTDSWVKRKNEENSTRHLTRWQRQEPSTTLAVLLFQIVIPESELRMINVEKKLQNVNWIEPPEPGCVTKVECYLTPTIDMEDIKHIIFPHPPLFYFQLPNKNWFVLLVHHDVMTEENLQILNNAHKSIEQRSLDIGIDLKPEYRAFFGIHHPTQDIHGIIEVTPIPRVG